MAEDEAKQGGGPMLSVKAVGRRPGGLLMGAAAPVHQHGPSCLHEHGHAGDDPGHAHGHDHPTQEEHDHAHHHGLHTHDHPPASGGEHGHAHDHAGHDHAGHDHAGHDHSGHDHDHGRAERPPTFVPAENGGAACQMDLEALLPGETDDKGRFEQLERALENQPGIVDVHLRSDAGFFQACIHYESQAVTQEDLVKLTRTVGARVARRFLTKTWFVRGMDSPQCATVIEHSLNRLRGVLSADVAYGAERLVVEFDRDVVRESDIERRASALGHELDDTTAGHACSHHHQHGGLAPRLAMPLSIFSGVCLAVGFALEHLTAAGPEVITPLYAIALATGGVFATRDALNSLKQFRFDIETLMVLAAVGAGLLGAWFEGGFLLFLFSLGHSLEHRAMDRARHAIEALSKLRPDKARIRRGSEVIEVDVFAVRRGDTMIIRPGDRIPLDGTIRVGQSSLDQSALTGESVPAPKGPGDEVFAGSINTERVLEVEVSRLSHESAISRVVDLVTQAEAQKSPTQRFTARVERIFVPLILVAAPAVAAVLLWQGMPFKEALLRAISMLVAASPCALAISTPSAVLSAVARAARGGVLMKGGAHLEALGKVSTMAFDKTGTLTMGKPRLVTIKAMEGASEAELLRAAAGAEAQSSHPIAHAIMQGAADRGVEAGACADMEIVHGKGVAGKVDGQDVAVGNLELFAGTALPAGLVDDVTAMQDAGQTTMVVRLGGRFLGVMGVADTARPEAPQMLARLRLLGIKRTVMLSGDNIRVARAIGAQLGITEPRAPLLPEDKVRAVRELARDGGVAMVGDGVNDAPALATASVGIAMGGAGSDVALETADVVLMGDDLTRLPFAVALARDATRAIRQNLVISLGVSAVLVLASVFGWVRIAQAVVLHEGSTLLVVANGLRLLAWKDRSA